jgi:hypothetical protein
MTLNEAAYPIGICLAVLAQTPPNSLVYEKLAPAEVVYNNPFEQVGVRLVFAAKLMINRYTA